MDDFEAICSSLGSANDTGNNQQSYEPWPELDLFDIGAANALAGPTDNLEEIYSEVHRSVDHVVSAINRQGLFIPETIKVQNRKVVNKLSDLENEVQRRTPSASISSPPWVARASTVPNGMLPSWLWLLLLEILMLTILITCRAFALLWKPIRFQPFRC